MASSPDNDGTVRHCQTGPGPASKAERCTRETDVKAPQVMPSGRNLVDGRTAVHAHTPVGDSEAGFDPRWGGHGESLRRIRGEAAGAQSGTDPANRFMVNVGTISTPPHRRPARPGGGKARRPLMAPRWDGVLVVVRGRESRLHGEGGQQDQQRSHWRIRRRW